jgi:hypothetical protein
LFNFLSFSPFSPLNCSVTYYSVYLTEQPRSDLEYGLNCSTDHPAVTNFPTQPDCIDEIRFKQTGAAKLGYPIAMTMKIYQDPAADTADAARKPAALAITLTLHWPQIYSGDPLYLQDSIESPSAIAEEFKQLYLLEQGKTPTASFTPPALDYTDFLWEGRAFRLNP